MYSTLALKTNSKKSGRIIGTHQKLDKIAYKIVSKRVPENVKFPSISQILLFEGMGGPDGLKRKSPGKDEPMHFINPQNDDGVLISLIDNHHMNALDSLAYIVYHEGALQGDSECLEKMEEYKAKKWNLDLSK